MTKHTALILASALTIWTTLPLTAGELANGGLSGTLVYEGDPYPKRNISSFPLGGIKNDTLLVNPNGGGIANAVVSLTPITNIKNAVHGPKRVMMRATDTGFSPRVAVLRAGDTLQVNNMGATGHNINIQSFHNAPMNATLSPGDQLTFTPSRPERWPVPVRCSIKSWMGAWIVVSDSPYVAVSDESGQFEFRDVMAGEYDVEIWHERTGAVKGVDIGNPRFSRSTEGYKLRFETGLGDLGRLALAAGLFNKD